MTAWHETPGFAIARARCMVFFNMHLLLPLAASFLFVVGLILIKRAGVAGVSPITTLLVTNLSSCLAFSVLWSLGGTFRGWPLLWQPAVIAGLFMLGLTLTFAAIERGDVSIATPVFGVKVVFVALLLTAFKLQELPMAVWYAAVLATIGIAMIQWTGRGHPKRIVFTVALALSAAVSFATFDVLIQRWAPSWGAGRFIPIVYWIVGLTSLAMLPWARWDELRQPHVLRTLLLGCFFISMQAICIVVAVAVFGDAARVNVVYALRGLWGVLLAWAIAKIWGGAESEHSSAVMLTRAAGAIVLTSAVILVILSSRSPG